MSFEETLSEKEVHEKDAEGVDQHIPELAFTKGNEGLVILVGCGIENRDDRRIKEGFRASVRSVNSGVKCPKKEEIEKGVFCYMGCLFNEKIMNSQIKEG